MRRLTDGARETLRALEAEAAGYADPGDGPGLTPEELQEMLREAGDYLPSPPPTADEIAAMCRAYGEDVIPF